VGMDSAVMDSSEKSKFGSIKKESNQADSQNRYYKPQKLYIRCLKYALTKYCNVLILLWSNKFLSINIGSFEKL